MALAAALVDDPFYWAISEDFGSDLAARFLRAISVQVTNHLEPTTKREYVLMRRDG